MAFFANPQSIAYAARRQSHECCVKNGTLVLILGALISVRSGFDSGFGCLPERDRRLALGKRCGWPRAILAITGGSSMPVLSLSKKRR